jgi:hypothetical protein
MVFPALDSEGMNCEPGQYPSTTALRLSEQPQRHQLYMTLPELYRERLKQRRIFKMKQQAGDLASSSLLFL